jgi:hypothetical protein
MDKFTNIKKNEIKRETNEDLFKNDEMSIIKFDQKDIITSKDQVVILPLFKDEGFVLMKYEKLPAFKFKYKDKAEYSDQDFYLTSIKGDYNDDETPTQNVRRILHEKTGVVLNHMFPIEVDKVLFKQENNVGQYHICILIINYNDFKQSSVQTTEENKVVKISLGDIDNIKTYDLVTDYCILKLKYENNIS